MSCQGFSVIKTHPGPDKKHRITVPERLTDLPQVLRYGTLIMFMYRYERKIDLQTMGEIMSRFGMPIKLSISVLCIAALFLLFIVAGRAVDDDEQDMLRVTEEDGVRDAFGFDPEELTYDGREDLDLLEGVSLDEYSLQDLKNMVFIRISTGENKSEKIIEYSADTDEGRARSKRRLHLKNYSGPEITLPDKMPSVTRGTVGHLAEIMQSENAYEVNDGFGNDARDYVQVEIEKTAQNSSQVQCTFILENEFGDRAVAKADVILSDVPAVITLTDTTVRLNKGEPFDPARYVEKAADADGRSILEEVTCTRIDTSQTGEYEALYRLRGETASLRVVVSE